MQEAQKELVRPVGKLAKSLVLRIVFREALKNFGGLGLGSRCPMAREVFRAYLGSSVPRTQNRSPKWDRLWF